MTAPIEYVTTRYRCPFCRRSYARQSVASTHMVGCFANPAVRGCETCAHRIDNNTLRGECGVGARDDGPYCRVCGEQLADDYGGYGGCSEGHTKVPIYGLRVHCDQWEGQPS